MKHLAAVLLFSLTLVTATVLSSPAADVEIVVEGVDAVKGKLLIGFYDSEKTFRTEELEFSPTIQITQAGKISSIAKGIKPGIYAVAVIWDQNENGILDTSGPFKKPTEPYGFSNNPKNKFGPPKYKECTFRVTEEGGRLVVVLKK